MFAPQIIEPLRQTVNSVGTEKNLQSLPFTDNQITSPSGRIEDLLKSLARLVTTTSIIFRGCGSARQSGYSSNSDCSPPGLSINPLRAAKMLRSARLFLFFPEIRVASVPSRSIINVSSFSFFQQASRSTVPWNRPARCRKPVSLSIQINSRLLPRRRFTSWENQSSQKMVRCRVLCLVYVGRLTVRVIW